MQNLIDDPSIPSVGQQIVVEGYTIAVSARCQCASSGSPVLISLTCSASGTAITAGVCPKCKLAYSIQGMELDAQARLKFGVAILSSKADTAS